MTAIKRGGPVFSQRSLTLPIAGLAVLAALSACSWLPNVGPSRSEISTAAKPNEAGQASFALVDVNPTIVAAMDKWSALSLQGTFGAMRPPSQQRIGVGDSVQIVLWETGGLFSAPPEGRTTPGTRSAAIPEQAVGADGLVTVPYAGRIRAAGRTPSQVEEDIVERLKNQALTPQAVVTVTKNISNTVSVLGEVTSGARVPLSARGDRILDVIAAAGGTKAPAHEIFLTLMRGDRAVRVPMQAILSSPSENVPVMPGDVITVAREPQNFTAIGATGQNALLPFDAAGITLEQAIGRAGGLNDQRADAGGVYVIRFEPSGNYDQLALARPSPGATGEVPVIYRVDMHNPSGFFLARRFPIHNKDILFVSNAPATDIQKVGSIISTFLLPAGTIIAVGAVTRN